MSSATNQLTTRRSVLRKGLAALGALAGAGAVLGSRSTNALAASGSFNASGGGNAAVTADATAGATGVKITTDGGPAVDVHGGAISVVNMNGGQGVSGYSQHSTGVSGVTSQPGGWAVAGIAFGTKATGVYGEGIESGGPGVFGNADEGDGVIGSSGRSSGVLGKSVLGYGGSFQGGAAPLHLEPAPVKGHPTTGAHNRGDFWVDSAGVLFFCVAGGTPGVWKRVRLF